MNEKIVIYHTNDIHSHFRYWPRIEREIKRRRNIHKNLKESVFVFDIGDFIDRFHPFTEGTLGKGNAQMLNECGYDAVTIGNNEGITLPHEDLQSLYRDAEFDCIVANLYTKDGKRPDWAKPYHIYQTEKGTNIGVVGVTINFTNFYEPLNWNVTNPFDELRALIPFLRSRVDLLIVLSHLGLSDDERMAAEFPEIDIVLGAHTHHVLPEGKPVNNSLLCCTGKYGMNLGKVEIFLDENKQVAEKRAELIPSAQLEPVEDEEFFDDTLYKLGKELLQQPVACLPDKLETDWFQETELNYLLCSSLTEWCNADCSFINAGVLLDDLPAGIVTEYDVHRICPHPINPCTVKLSGRELKEVLIQTEDDKYTTLEIKGFGFRGEIFGKVIYDNISIDGKGSSAKIRINGEDIRMDRIYRVATLDMFTFARFYPPVTRAEKEFFLPEFLRDLLKWKLSKLYPVKTGK